MAQFIPVDPFDLVIFGGTGDLSKRKLLPALFHRDSDGQFPPGSRIIGASRSTLSNEEFVALVREALETHLSKDALDDAVWQRFSARLSYHALDITTPDGWPELVAALNDAPADAAAGPRCRVFYMATAPRLFGETAHRL
ncbi:MAG: glucose-6-phosphate dehydrogenase, partial [Pseudomonadota bacterium]